MLIAQRRTVDHACRKFGATWQTLCRRRKEYGGLKSDQVKRLKEPERENALLKRLADDSDSDKSTLQEDARPRFWNPKRKRRSVRTEVDRLRVSERRSSPFVSTFHTYSALDRSKINGSTGDVRVDSSPVLVVCLK